MENEEFTNRNALATRWQSNCLTLLGCGGGGKGVYGFFSLLLTFFCLTFFLQNFIT